MVLLSSILAIASLARLAYCQDSNYTVDASSVDERTKEQWCISQTSACPLICLQLPGTTDEPISNDCDDETLVYSCICSNNQSPNASEYSQTIPYYLCTEKNNRCVSDCPQTDSSCQSNCRSQNPCGAQNPRRPNDTSTDNSTATGTATATTSTVPPFTGVPGDDDDEGAAVGLVLDMGRVYGLVVVLGGFFAGFTILL
ncbi:uncharacterized protein BDV17DRAFT_277118 [Aspergillus undulatus]|uniref:uncharacterized protein n=1 Tax=Aspergillus undulatus TaxID=1810928 RepID=UPI003CCD3C8B